MIDEIVRYARESAPEECCGLLLGKGDRIHEARPARNRAEQPTTRFLIDPHDHFEAMRAARSGGLEIVGFYHSHPRSPAVPSETDRAEVTYPDYLALIVGLLDGATDVRLYRWVEGNFLEVPLVTAAE